MSRFRPTKRQYKTVAEVKSKMSDPFDVQEEPDLYRIFESLHKQIYSVLDELRFLNVLNPIIVSYVGIPSRTDLIKQIIQLFHGTTDEAKAQQLTTIKVKQQQHEYDRAMQDEEDLLYPFSPTATNVYIQIICILLSDIPLVRKQAIFRRNLLDYKANNIPMSNVASSLCRHLQQEIQAHRRVLLMEEVQREQERDAQQALEEMQTQFEQLRH